MIYEVCWTNHRTRLLSDLSGSQRRINSKVPATTMEYKREHKIETSLSVIYWSAANSFAWRRNELQVEELNLPRIVFFWNYKTTTWLSFDLIYASCPFKSPKNDHIFTQWILLRGTKHPCPINPLMETTIRYIGTRNILATAYRWINWT